MSNSSALHGPTENQNWRAPKKHSYCTSISRLASALDISKRTLENYISRYQLKPGKRGWSTRAVASTLRADENARRQAHAAAQLDGKSPRQIEHQLKAAQAQRELVKLETEKLKLAQLKKELIDLASAQEAISAIASKLRQGLEQIVKSIPKKHRPAVKSDIVTLCEEISQLAKNLHLDQPQ